MTRKVRSMPYGIFFFIIAISLVQPALAGVNLNVYSSSDSATVTTWPVAYTDATVADPCSFDIPESDYNDGNTPISLAQSWTATQSGYLSHVQIFITGSPSMSFKINLYDANVWDGNDASASDWSDVGDGIWGGGIHTYQPDVNVTANLFSSSLPVTWNGYGGAGGTCAVLDFAFSGQDLVAIDANHQYIFEITEISSSNPDDANMIWFRNGATGNYTSGQAFRCRSPINGNPARDFTLAATVVQLEDLAITKCTVKTGKTQYAEQGPDACDVSKMKDGFDITAAVLFPEDLNDINTIDVNVISTTDLALIYSETLDFNSAVANVTGKFSYSYKIPKYTEGAITSLKMDFVKNTVKLKAKNVDLTGLRSPIQVDIGMGQTTFTSEIDETIINGSRKIIPTRLLRLYDDTLVVTKARASDGAGVNDARLTVKGDVADANMDLDTNEPNLAEIEVIFTWSDANDVNVSTFTLPAGSFTQTGKGHTYKCKSAPADEGGLVTAKIDLDKCTFQCSIKETDDVYVGPGDAKFAVTYAAFNRSDQYSIE